jgi:hypothetical protein
MQHAHEDLPQLLESQLCLEGLAHTLSDAQFTKQAEITK